MFWGERMKKLLATMGLLLGFLPGISHSETETVAEMGEEQGSNSLEESDFSQPVARLPEQEGEPSPFLQEATLKAQARSFYFNRDQPGSRSLAWAAGGSLGFNSGYWADRLAVGAVLYTSQPLYAPSGDGGTGILKNNQASYSALGQLYLDVKLDERLFAKLGRAAYDTPFINQHDVRMTPKTFEGISLIGASGKHEQGLQWRYGLGFITKMKDWTAQDFEWMSRVAGAHVNRGVAVAGANVRNRQFSVGVIDYYANDILNTLYSEANARITLPWGHKLHLAAQYADQRSTGDDLLTGSAFATHQSGAKAEWETGPALWMLAYTKTASGANMQNPWSGYPGFTSAQVQNFNRANESAVMLRAGYDFSRHGLTGFSAYALGVHGSGRPTSQPNFNEVDLNLQWKPQQGRLSGASFRLRYAHVDQQGGGQDTDDMRLIVNYDFSLW